MKIVKLNKISLHPFWDELENYLYLATTSQSDYLHNEIGKYYGAIAGTIALSVKKGKKRILIKGRIDAEVDSTQMFGLEYKWFFRPKENHLNKLLIFLKDQT